MDTISNLIVLYPATKSDDATALRPQLQNHIYVIWPVLSGYYYLSMQLDTALMTKPAKPKRGRPPLEDTALLAPKTVRFSKPMVREIEAIRAERALEQPDFGQVVRELVAEALERRKKR